MPELPEVETMVRGIRPVVSGRTIRDVVACPNSCKPISITPSFRVLRDHLVGKKVTDVRRLGKRVVFDVSGGANLVIEPRMTGLMVLANPPSTQHLRLRFDFRGRAEFDSLWFWDRRGLGTVTLLEPGEIETRFGPEAIGVDALEMTVEAWIDCCGKSRREIKVLLLDQKMVAGIGNLYASEILHLAGINPMTPANELSRKSIRQLSIASQSILRTAIDDEGSTLGDGTYRNALSQSGKYQNRHRVYMREGQPCSICRNGKITRIVQAQRSTFLCQCCQGISLK